MPTPVLIVGAGPVGMTMACELLRYRVPVRIVDKAPQRTDKSKALIVWSRTLELLDRSENLAGAFVGAGLKLKAANAFAGGERLAHLGFEDVQSPFPFGLSLPQSETERLLEERLGALGVKVEREVELTSFTQSDDKVSCVLRRADGREETVEAAWLIGCDGAHSSVRHGLALDFRGDTLPTDFALADLKAAGLDTPRDEIAIHLHEDGVALFFPISGSRYRIIADLGPTQAGGAPDLSFEQVQALVIRRVPGVTLSDPIWISRFSINERKVDSYRVGRVFVAGDAAHVHSPAGGQGMNTGMQDAFNLAWKLALAIKGVADPALLDSYSRERSPVAKQVLADSGRLTAAATTKNPILEHLRNFVARHVLGFEFARHALADRLSEISIAYPDSPLNVGSTHGLNGPAPGHRLIDGAPFGQGDSPRFALIAAPAPEASDLIAKYPALMENGVRAPIDSGGLWLVRPDGYVAAVSRAGDWAPLTEFLDRLTRR
jgi:2-polyprenyl-6-methoxyphenol hydroxylase-like FAD-dependent oxidoreductase